MFFFFAGGVNQQVRQVIKSGAGRCINCGSEANLVDYDNVLKLFFVPVWRWPGKKPLMNCNNCNLFFPQSLSSPDSRIPAEGLRCRSCDRAVDADFRFCPFCGSTLDTQQKVQASVREILSLILSGIIIVLSAVEILSLTMLLSFLL